MSANILFLRANYALCNWHVWDCMKQYENVKLVNVDMKEGYEYPVSAIKERELKYSDAQSFKDAVILEFPRSIRPHRNIVKHFVKSQDISKFSKAPGILAGLSTAGRAGIVYRVEPLQQIRAQDSLKYSYVEQIVTGKQNV